MDPGQALWRWTARLAPVGLATVLALAAPRPARAVDIQPNYDPNITAEQKAVIEAKIALWEQRLPHQSPEHVVTISFANADLGTLLVAIGPDAEWVLADGSGLRGDEGLELGVTDNFTNNADGRPTGARIRFNSNAAVSWHTGLTEPVPADKYDFWTVVNHEIAHALGFTVNNPRFRRNVTTTAGGGRRYEGGGEGGTPTGTLTPADQGTHTDPGTHPGDLMNPNLPKGVRRAPSQLDIDILLDDVWRYPQIAGSLSNFDVWNRCGLIANDFQVTLGGVLPGSVTGLYNGVLNPFSPGTVTPSGDSSVIKWGPGPGQVNPGGSAHFGFRITGDLTPLSFKFEWTQNNTVICTVPVSGTTWRQLADAGVRNRITNTAERVMWVQRRINFSPAPILLEQLVPGSLLDMTALPVDMGPVPIAPGESIVFDFPPQPTLAAVVLIATFFDELGGLPGEPLGTWFEAAELVAAPPPPCPGDFNCDRQINFADIDPLVAALTTQDCCDGTGANCDMNGDGLISFADIDPFIVVLSAGQGCP